MPKNQGDDKGKHASPMRLMNLPRCSKISIESMKEEIDPGSRRPISLFPILFKERESEAQRPSSALYREDRSHYYNVRRLGTLDINILSIDTPSFSKSYNYYFNCYIVLLTALK